MVRTRADSSVRKAVAAKAPRKQVGSSSSAGSSSKTPSKKGNYSSGGGGNALRVCDIPAWQKGISEFYPKLKSQKKTSDSVAESGGNEEKPSSAAASSGCQPGSSLDAGNGEQMECQTGEGGSNSPAEQTQCQPGSSSDAGNGEQMECEASEGGSNISAKQTEVVQETDRNIQDNDNEDKEKVSEQGGSSVETSKTNTNGNAFETVNEAETSRVINEGEQMGGSKVADNTPQAGCSS